MNKWMYTVLLDTVLTPTGKAIVRGYNSTRDARSALHHLQKDAVVCVLLARCTLRRPQYHLYFSS